MQQVTCAQGFVHLTGSAATVTDQADRDPVPVAIGRITAQ